MMVLNLKRRPLKGWLVTYTFVRCKRTKGYKPCHTKIILYCVSD